MHLIRTAAALVGAAALSFVLQGQDQATGAAACTTTFTTSSGSWATASNWSAGLPTATSYACIPVGSTATLAGTATVDGVRIDGTLAGAGLLTVTDQAAVSESELDGSVNGTRLTIQAGSLLVTTATLDGAGILTTRPGATARVTNSSGSYGLYLSGSGRVVNNGTLTLQHVAGSATLHFNGTAPGLTNNGTLDLVNGADVTGGGTLSLAAGSLTRSAAPAGTSSIDAPVSLAGRVEPTAGVLTLQDVAPAAGTTSGVLSTDGGELRLVQVSVPDGVRINTEGSPVLDGNVHVVGTGEFRVVSGTLQVETASLTGTGAFAVAPAGAVGVVNASGSYGLYVSDSAEVVNNGTLTLQHVAGSATLHFNGTAPGFTNNGTLALVNGADITGGGALTNATTGTVVKTTGTIGSSEITSVVENDGTITSSVGVLSVDSGAGPGASMGTFTAADSATLEVGGVVLDEGATLAGPTGVGDGSVRIAGSEVTVPAGATATTSGRAGMDGSLGGAGTLEIASGSFDVVTAALNGSATVRVEVGATARVTNSSGSYGLYLWDSGRVVNNGTLTLQHVAGSATLHFNGTAPGLTNNGTLDLVNGADVTGGGTLLNAATGAVTKTAGTAESTVSARTDCNGTVYASNGILNFDGTVVSIVGDRLDEGTWHAVSPGKIRLPVDVQRTAATIILDGADAMLQDSGTTTDALTDLVSQTPSGSLTVRGGRVQPVGALVQQGTVVVGPGAGSRINAPSYTQTAGTTTLLSADAVLKTTGATRVNGGTLRGIGTVEAGGTDGLKVDLGGRLESGLDAIGTLTVTGNLVLGNGGKLAVDVDGPAVGQADRVDVSGTMTVGGEVVIDSGYTPALNDQVQVLASIGARTGKFASASGGDLPGQISWAADYGANDVKLVAARPGIRIGNATVVETDGATNLVFTVTQSRTLLTTASVTAATSDGTAVVGGPAIGGHDYDARTGTVTVGFDQTTATFSVPVVGDDVYEHDETLDVTISAPNNGAISDATGTGTITNDEPVPTLTVAAVTEPVVEGDSGSQSGLLEARLSGVSSFTTGASWATADGTATSADYTGGSGTISFAPGDTAEPVAIAITGDTATEADEYFDVTFSGGTPPGDVTLPPSRTITILDDDAQVSVADATVDEPATGTAQVPVTFFLDRINPRPVQFNVATSDGTASAPGDYTAVNQTATIPAGTLEVTVPVTVNADGGGEPDELFTIAASSVVGGQPGDTSATVTILSSTCTFPGATAGNDVLRGTPGDDVICGLGGNDVIYTSGGNDRIYGGSPAGDAGVDTVSHAGKTCPLEADIRNHFAKSTPQTCTGLDVLIGIENLVGGGGNDTLRGGTGANRLDGGNGNDVLLGDAGNDRIIGGGGFGDFVSYDRGTVKNSFVQDGTTYVNHGVTVDLAIVAGPQNTRGAGNDWIGTEQNGSWIQTVEGVLGSPYNDWIRGNGAANQLSGVNGNDSITGLGGPDVIFGLLGDDALKGDGGVDEVYGGEGTDTVNGGADADVWLTGGPGGGDRVYGDAGAETGDAIQGGEGVNDLCRQDGPTSAFFNGSGCEV